MSEQTDREGQAMADSLFRPLLTKEKAKELCGKYPIGEDAAFEEAGKAILNCDYS